MVRVPPKSVILVGNGPSVFHRRLGSVIDSFDIVVRFNRFATKGYEECVGRRTDYWFTVSNRSRQGKQRLKFQRTYWWKTKGFSRFRRAYPDAVNIDPEILDWIAEVANVPADLYSRWSTGAIAAAVLLREFPLINIIGFDWWDADKEGRHHYSDKHERGTLHKPEYEKMFFNALVEAGAVEDLNERSTLGEL